eukprot:4086058-Heterocapsa_arctica.AAC.1
MFADATRTDLGKKTNTRPAHTVEYKPASAPSEVQWQERMCGKSRTTSTGRGREVLLQFTMAASNIDMAS